MVYELQLTNVRPQPSTVERVDVLDADNESRVVETFSGAVSSTGCGHWAQAHDEPGLEPNAARLMLIELAFDRR